MNLNSVLVVVFWLGFTLLVAIYVLYPLVVRIAARGFGTSVRESPVAAEVSIIITAYNEEKAMAAKLANVMAAGAAISLKEIIVASDASTDSTDSIVRSYEGSGVRLLRVEGRQGKTACQNAAAAAARGEVLIFTDATTHIHPAALQNLLRRFADPQVGCVAGRLVYRSNSVNTTGKGNEAYWDYEIKLRLAESALGSLIGVSGCLYGVRRSAYQPIDPALISDFVIAMKMREQSLRTVLAPDAICFEETLNKGGHELSMRVRVAIRSLNALFSERKFLNPFRFGLFACQLWAHKLLRYASPFVWLSILFANAILAIHNQLYALLFAVQVVVIGLGAAGFVLQAHRSRLGALWRPYYFLLTNLASLIGAVRYLRGERMVTWKPIR
jgi:cellulose synthase/poly-beta-1,6-N-acetylglucosamine synthase-like glycosyltransferase